MDTVVRSYAYYAYVNIRKHTVVLTSSIHTHNLLMHSVGTYRKKCTSGGGHEIPLDKCVSTTKLIGKPLPYHWLSKGSYGRTIAIMLASRFPEFSLRKRLLRSYYDSYHIL